MVIIWWLPKSGKNKNKNIAHKDTNSWSKVESDKYLKNKKGNRFNALVIFTVNKKEISKGMPRPGDRLCLS